MLILWTFVDLFCWPVHLLDECSITGHLLIHFLWLIDYDECHITVIKRFIFYDWLIIVIWFLRCSGNRWQWFSVMVTNKFQFLLLSFSGAHSGEERWFWRQRQQLQWRQHGDHGKPLYCRCLGNSSNYTNRHSWLSPAVYAAVLGWWSAMKT